MTLWELLGSDTHRSRTTTAKTEITEETDQETATIDAKKWLFRYIIIILLVEIDFCRKIQQK